MADEERRLDPQAKALIERAAASGAPALHTLSAPEARRVYRETRLPLAPARESMVAMAETSDILIPGPAGEMRARIYRAAPRGEALPGMLYFHGGGWVYGDLDTHDAVCRGIANQARCVVVSVDYRLAPEHKFPAAVEDSIAATRWVAANAKSLGVDAANLIVAGDSAGGNLAAVTALALRDELTLAMQVLIYPLVDFALNTPSHSHRAQGYLLTRDNLLWTRDCYLRGEGDVADWRASPLRAQDLSRLPPAYIVTAGFDPLCDEGRLYAERLQQAGVAVMHECFEGQVHGFIVMGGIMAAAHHAIYRIGQALRSQLTRRTI